MQQSSIAAVVFVIVGLFVFAKGT